MAGELQAFDATGNTGTRPPAKSGIRSARLSRTFALIVLERTHNMLATKLNAILTAIDNASNLTTLKSAIALITDAPTYTPAQLKQAIRDKIDAGEAD